MSITRTMPNHSLFAHASLLRHVLLIGCLLVGLASHAEAAGWQSWGEYHVDRTVRIEYRICEPGRNDTAVLRWRITNLTNSPISVTMHSNVTLSDGSTPHPGTVIAHRQRIQPGSSFSQDHNCGGRWGVDAPSVAFYSARWNIE